MPLLGCFSDRSDTFLQTSVIRISKEWIAHPQNGLDEPKNFEKWSARHERLLRSRWDQMYVNSAAPVQNHATNRIRTRLMKVCTQTTLHMKTLEQRVLEHARLAQTEAMRACEAAKASQALSHQLELRDAEIVRLRAAIQAQQSRILSLEAAVGSISVQDRKTDPEVRFFRSRRVCVLMSVHRALS